MTVELLQYMKKEMDRMDVDHAKRMNAFVKFHKQFRGVHDKTRAGSKSRLFIQRTKVACMAGVANVADVIFPSDDFFDAVGRNDEDVQGAEATKKVMQWVLKLGRFFRETVLYLLQASIYGVAFAKIVTKEVTEVVIDKLPQMLSPEDPQVVGIETKQRMKTVKFAKLEMVDVADVWIDNGATNIDEASGLFQRFRRTLQYLRRQEKKGNYKNVEDVARLIESRQSRKKSRKATYDKDDRRRQSVGLPPLEEAPDMVTLYEYWGKIPADIAEAAGIETNEDEFEVECIVTIAEMEVILRAERNTNPGQLRMWVSDVWEPSGDKSLYGRGIPENVRGSQQALNVTVNLRLDNKAWAIAAPLVVNLDKMENPDEDLIARVNWIIRGRGASPSEIAQFAQIPDMTGNSILEANEFERHIDEESGMNKAVQATQNFGSNRTFGGISLAYSAAARPIRLVAKGFEDNLISQGLKRIFLLTMASLDDEMVVRVTDDPRAPEFIRVDPLSLALDVDFIASGSFALTQRDQVIQGLQAFWDALSKMPTLAQAPNWNWKYMAQKLYEATGLKDFHKVWLDKPQQGMLPGVGGQGGPTAQAQGGAIPGAEAAGVPEGDGIISALADIGRMAGGGEGQG